MSLESYRRRVLASGSDITEAYSNDTKLSQIDSIMNSPSKKMAYLNMDESKPIPIITTDLSTFHIRRLMFLPDSKVYTGDYVCVDGFTYIATDQTLSEEFPQLIGRICNFDFPIKIGEEKVQIGTRPNGQPIWATKPKFLMKPSSFTSKDYSVITNAMLNLPEGSMTAFIPYVEGEKIPYINQIVERNTLDYKIMDIIDDNIILFGDGCKRGYWEIRLQKVVNTQDE